MIPFFNDFLRILEASWAPSWGYVGTMLAKKPYQRALQKKLKKSTQKTMPEEGEEK